MSHPKTFPKKVHGTFWDLKQKTCWWCVPEGIVGCLGTSTAPSYFTGFETPSVLRWIARYHRLGPGMGLKVWWNMILVLEIMPLTFEYIYIWHTNYTFRMAILATLAKGTSLKNKSRFSQELMLLFFESFSVSNSISKTHWNKQQERCRGRCRLSSRSPSIPRLFINLRGIPAFDGASPASWLPPWPLLYKPHEVLNSTWNNNNNNNTIQQWVKEFKGAVIHDTLGSSHQLRSLNPQDTTRKPTRFVRRQMFVGPIGGQATAWQYQHQRRILIERRWGIKWGYCVWCTEKCDDRIRDAWNHDINPWCLSQSIFESPFHLPWFWSWALRIKMDAR